MRSSTMKAGLIGSVISGLAALVLITASAFVPWFEWAVWEGAEAQMDRTGIGGPPSFVPGTPYGSVEISAHDQSVLDLSVCVYLAVLLLGLASALLYPFWTLSERLGTRKAAVAAGSVGLLLYVGIAIGAGLLRFILDTLMRHSGARSTWIVTFELQNILVTGPLMLLAGAVLGIGTAVWALRRHRAQHSPRYGIVRE
jgi:positive regulator of sigma E activity